MLADTDENPQRRELGPRRQRMERRRAGVPTGAEGAVGQRDAGSTFGSANSGAQSEKPDMMPRYRWMGYCTGVLVEYGKRW